MTFALNSLRFGAIASAGGAPATGPDTWNLWMHLRANEGVTDTAGGVEDWVDRISGYSFEQATAGNKPVYTAEDADWNDQPSVGFVSSDYLQADEATLTRANQRFLHDKTQDYFGYALINRGTGTGLDALLNSQTGAGSTTGILIAVRGSDSFLRFQIYNGSVGNAASLAGGAAGDRVLIFWRVRTGTPDLGVMVNNSGTWTNAAFSLTADTGDSTAPLTIGAYGGGTGALTDADVVELGIGKYLPDSTRLTEIYDYAVARYGSLGP